MQASNDGMTTEAKSSFAPSKSRSQRIRYLTVPRLGETIVLLPLGQAETTVVVGLVIDDEVDVLEAAGLPDVAEAEVDDDSVAPAVSEVVKTVTVSAECDAIVFWSPPESVQG